MVTTEKTTLTMHTPTNNNLRGIERVRNYETAYRCQTQIFLSHSDLIQLMKQHYYYVQVKLTASRDGKRLAMLQVLNELDKYARQAKKWAAQQKQEMINIENIEFEVTIISAQGAQLLRIVNMFDLVMTEIAAAQFAGGQPDNIRYNYFRGFSFIFSILYDLAKKDEPHFHINGLLRDGSIDLIELKRKH
jgi:hypothetical protein